MTEEERAPFVAKSQSKKTEYAVTMQQYNMELANGNKTTGDDEKQEKAADD
jgi:hypothetical protein